MGAVPVRIIPTVGITANGMSAGVFVFRVSSKISVGDFTNHIAQSTVAISQLEPLNTQTILMRGIDSLRQHLSGFTLVN